MIYFTIEIRHYKILTHNEQQTCLLCASVAVSCNKNIVSAFFKHNE